MESDNQQKSARDAASEAIIFQIWRVLDDISEKSKSKFPDMDLGDLTAPDFILKLMKSAFSDPEISGDEFVETVRGWLTGIDRGVPIFFPVIDTAIGYWAQSGQASDAGDVEAEWEFLAKAEYWVGVLNALYWIHPLLNSIHYPNNKSSNPAAQMALKRHAASAEEKKRILDYWRENLDRTMSASKAATKIVETQRFSLEYRTIQSLISQAKKP